MIRAIDKALEIVDGEKANDIMDMKEIFDGFDPAKYETETKERWGRTDAYKESMRRTQGYTPEDWQRLKSEQDAIYRDAAAAMQAGKSPSDDDVKEIAERHRLCIERWFYPCNLVMHRGLANMWEADSRFSETIDKRGAGLTAFLARAVRANAAR